MLHFAGPDGQIFFTLLPRGCKSQARRAPRLSGPGGRSPQSRGAPGTLLVQTATFGFLSADDWSDRCREQDL